MPMPFPTGPLAVFGRDLSHAIFENCDFHQIFERSGRMNNLRGCDRRQIDLSWTWTSCDCALGNSMARCARELGINVTIAHMSATKAHSYSPRAGIRNFVAPSRLSVAVHGLKRHQGPSGPDLSEGGEWAHTHAVAGRDTGFPPLLWNFDPAAIGSGVLLNARLPSHHDWYARACGTGVEGSSTSNDLKKVAISRARAARGARGSDESEVVYLGGHVKSWPGFGCHPTRGYTYPSWVDLYGPSGPAIHGTHVQAHCTRGTAEGVPLVCDWIG